MTPSVVMKSAQTNAVSIDKTRSGGNDNNTRLVVNVLFLAEGPEGRLFVQRGYYRPRVAVARASHGIRGSFGGIVICRGPPVFKFQKRNIFRHIHWSQPDSMFSIIHVSATRFVRKPMVGNECCCIMR